MFRGIATQIERHLSFPLETFNKNPFRGTDQQDTILRKIVFVCAIALIAPIRLAAGKAHLNYRGLQSSQPRASCGNTRTKELLPPKLQ